MPKEKVAAFDFQIIAAGINQWELDKFFSQIEKAITAVITEAPNTKKVLLRSSKSFPLETVRKNTWKKAAQTPLKPNAIP